MEIELIPALKDNYIWLLHEPGSGAVGVVDPAEAEPVLALLEARGWRLSHIFNTHHHLDHVAGNEALHWRFQCPVIGAASDRRRIAGLTQLVEDGERIPFGGLELQVLATPGHTSGHLSYYVAEAYQGGGAVFCGDTLFALGCGRLFEGTADQMWASLGRLRALPPTTLVCCGHEYTASNLRFALNLEPEHPGLLAYQTEVETLRADERPTVPTTLAHELALNPFLRADQPELQQALGMAGADPARVFAEIRHRKDRF